MLRNIFLTLVASASTLAMSALEVTTEAGGLKEAVGDNAASATTLTVNGSLNYADLRFIAEEMPDLASVDLSHAAIASFESADLDVNRMEFAADEMPEYGLLGAKFSTIALPAGVKSIGEGAFAGNTRLTTVTIPASVTAMQSNAFNGCSALTTVNIEAQLAELPASTFAGCAALTSVALPASLKTIGDKAFAGTTALKSLSFPAALTTIGHSAFYGSGLTNATLAATALSTISDWAFANCASLEEVTLPNSVASIGAGAFFANVSLEEFSYPSNLTTVAPYAFKDNKSMLGQQVLHADVAEVGDYALAGWTRPEEVIMPTALRSLGSGAMANWASLARIDGTLMSVVPELGDDVWEGVNQGAVNLTVAPNLLNSFLATDQWKDFDISAGGQQEIVNTEDTASLGVKAWFDGTTLVVEAHEALAGVQLVDLSGRCYSLHVAPDTSHFTADTSAWEGPIFIVRAILPSGQAAIFKLIR